MRKLFYAVALLFVSANMNAQYFVDEIGRAHV